MLEYLNKDQIWHIFLLGKAFFDKLYLSTEIYFIFNKFLSSVVVTGKTITQVLKKNQQYYPCYQYCEHLLCISTISVQGAESALHFAPWWSSLSSFWFMAMALNDHLLFSIRMYGEWVIWFCLSLHHKLLALTFLIFLALKVIYSASKVT